MWLPFHVKQLRPSPCGKGRCVSTELEDGLGDGEIHLQLTMPPQIKDKTPSASAVEECTCSVYNEITLLDKSKCAQRCLVVPSIEFK